MILIICKTSLYNNYEAFTFNFMKRHIAHVSLVVEDYDHAIRFYVDKLNFRVVEDTMLTDTKRWVLIAPGEDDGCQLLLQKAVTDEQKICIGNQTGGKVFLFLHTDNFWRDYHQMIEQDIEFVRNPVVESYGTVAVFSDLYGNLWDLIEKVKSE